MKATNTYFETLLAEMSKWETLKEEHQAKKNPNFTLEENKAWIAERDELNAQKPYSDGEIKAYRYWRNSLERGLDFYVLDDFLWDKEIADFVKALRAAGIDTIYFTNTSTALMENLHALAAEGCTMEGLDTYQDKDWCGETKMIQCIRFSIN